ncbi:MAG: restriction endonuclease subunit S [Paludibacteraceae bacterium]|nr:restriction endonuclease subunit S [Paludibacteraceae bacterium]
MKEIKLGEIAKIITGKLDANAANENGKYPFFTCSREILRIDNYAYDCECVLVAGNGDLNVKYYRGKFNAYQRTYIITLLDNQKYSTTFVFRLIESYLGTLRKNSNGSTIKYIRIGDLTEISIPIIPLSDQERIVAFLDAEFEKIDQLKANAAAQLQAAKDLFQAALKEMLTPKDGWKYQPLGEITTSINGLWKGKKPPYVNVGVIRNANFTKDFTLNTSNIEYLDVEERQYKSRKLDKGDLIVEKSGGSEKQPVGRTILFDLEGDFSVSNFTSILRLKDKNAILPAFLYKYLLFVYKEGVTKTMQNAATGIHNIIYDQFLSIPIPVLPKEEQQRIVKLLDAITEKINSLRSNYDRTLTHCNDLKQALLKSIFA